MSFIRDGKRTWDSVRKFELKRTGGGKDGLYSFELSGPHGSIYFSAEWNPYKIDKKFRVNDEINPNADTIVEWIVSINSFLPGFDKVSTQDIIREAMKSFESGYGNATLRGFPVRDVVCKFEGKFA